MKEGLFFLFLFNFIPISAQSVSYTHLDVYKRQEQEYLHWPVYDNG